MLWKTPQDCGNDAVDRSLTRDGNDTGPNNSPGEEVTQPSETEELSSVADPPTETELWMIPGTKEFEESLITEAIQGLQSQSTAFFNSPIPSFLPEHTNKHFATDDLSVKDGIQVLFNHIHEPLYVYNSTRDKLIGAITSQSVLKLLLFQWFLHKECPERDRFVERLHLLVATLLIFYRDCKDIEYHHHVMVSPWGQTAFKPIDDALKVLPISEESRNLALDILSSHQWKWSDLHRIAPRSSLMEVSLMIDCLAWPEYRAFLGHVESPPASAVHGDPTFLLVKWVSMDPRSLEKELDEDSIKRLSEIKDLAQRLRGPFQSQKRRDSPWLMSMNTIMMLMNMDHYVPFVGMTRPALDALLMLLHLDIPTDVSVFSHNYGIPVGNIRTNTLLTAYIQHFRGEALEALLLSARKTLKIGTWGRDVKSLNVNEPLYALIDIMITTQWSSVPVVDDDGGFLCAITHRAVLDLFKESMRTSFSPRDDPVGVDLNSTIRSMMPVDVNGDLERSTGCNFVPDDGFALKPDYNNARTIRYAVEKGSLSSNSISTVIDSPFLVFSNDPILGYTTRFCPHWLSLPHVTGFRRYFPMLNDESPCPPFSNRHRPTDVQARRRGSFTKQSNLNYDSNASISELKRELYVPCAVTDDDVSLRELITILALSDENRCFFLEPGTNRIRGLVTQKEVLRAITNITPSPRATIQTPPDINADPGASRRCCCYRMTRGVDCSDLPELETEPLAMWLAPKPIPPPTDHCIYEYGAPRCVADLLTRKLLLSEEERKTVIKKLPNMSCVSVQQAFNQLC